MTCKDCVHYEVCQDKYVSEKYRHLCQDYCCFKDKAKFVELPCKIEDVIDTIVSHNSKVSINIEDENDRHYLKSLFVGMAWQIPNEIKKMNLKRIYACMHDNPFDGDVLQIEVYKQKLKE